MTDTTTSPVPPNMRVAGGQSAAPHEAQAEKLAPSRKPRALAVIAADLERTTALLIKAQETTRVADKAEGEASMKVNELQLEFDAVVHDMRAKAPTSTAWNLSGKDDGTRANDGRYV